MTTWFTADPHAASFDVGVDAPGFRLLSFEDVEAIMRLKMPSSPDYHKADHP